MEPYFIGQCWAFSFLTIKGRFYELSSSDLVHKAGKESEAFFKIKNLSISSCVKKKCFPFFISFNWEEQLWLSYKKRSLRGWRKYLKVTRSMKILVSWLTTFWLLKSSPLMVIHLVKSIGKLTQIGTLYSPTAECPDFIIIHSKAETFALNGGFLNGRYYLFWNWGVFKSKISLVKQISL